MVNYVDRADLYNKAFPNRPGLLASNNMVVGTFMIGACYKNPARMPDGSSFYGAYPRGYLERIHAMFPDARNILHVFSGGLTLELAEKIAWPGNWMCPKTDDISMELVDIHGPEQGRYPTWQGDLFNMPDEWTNRFDLVIADPPYSAADAVKYDCPAPNRRKIMYSLRRVTAKAGNLVFLDQCWPQHRKVQWKTWATIGLIRSTNHRMRLVSIFQAV